MRLFSRPRFFGQNKSKTFFKTKTFLQFYGGLNYQDIFIKTSRSRPRLSSRQRLFFTSSRHLKTKTSVSTISLVCMWRRCLPTCKNCWRQRKRTMIVCYTTFMTSPLNSIKMSVHHFVCCCLVVRWLCLAMSFAFIAVHFLIQCCHTSNVDVFCLFLSCVFAPWCY